MAVTGAAHDLHFGSARRIDAKNVRAATRASPPAREKNENPVQVSILRDLGAFCHCCNITNIY
jgi:hypothetical protein